MVSSARPFAVVTGASTGIGFHLARIFAQNGYDLLITAEEDRIQDAERELQSTGVAIKVVKDDLTKKKEVERLWHAPSTQSHSMREWVRGAASSMKRTLTPSLT
jgi:short-subunit dehydrogenase